MSDSLWNVHFCCLYDQAITALTPCARCQATGVRENIRFGSAEMFIGIPTYSAKDHPERGQSFARNNGIGNSVHMEFVWTHE